MNRMNDIFQAQLMEFNRELHNRYEEREIRSILLILWEEYIGFRPHQSFMMPGFKADDIDLKKFDEALASLKEGHPVHHIINKAWFMDMTLHVNSDVLIPRKETEELCYNIIRDYRSMRTEPKRIIDIGTGSGCIAIAMKRAFQSAGVFATDISEKAIRVAALNAEQTRSSINFSQYDVMRSVDLPWEGAFDLIISNPPYVLASERALMPSHVADHEPITALFVPDGDPLCFYRAIGHLATRKLVPGGGVYFEINEKFGTEVCTLLASLGFSDILLEKDLQGKDRFVRAISG